MLFLPILRQIWPVQDYLTGTQGRNMKFGEMLGWALRLRPLAVLRAWVGARGPAGGIWADGLHGSRILELDVSFPSAKGPQDAQ